MFPPDVIVAKHSGSTKGDVLLDDGPARRGFIQIAE
jgi:hypothetical protein